MMDFVLPVFGIAVGIGALMLLIGNQMYEVQAIRRRKHYLEHKTARLYRRRPLITVLVQAQDAADTIELCLASVAASTYRKYEIIVVDFSSADDTRRLVRGFMKRYPKKSVHLLAESRSNYDSGVLGKAYRKLGHGEYILTLNASSTLGKNALTQAARRSNQQPVAVLQFTRHIDAGLSLVGIFQQLEALLGSYVAKMRSCFGLLGVRSYTDALWRRDAFTAEDAREQVTPLYEKDAVVVDAPVRNLRHFLYSMHLRRRLRLPRGLQGHSLQQVVARLAASVPSVLYTLLLPVFVGYSLYLAIYFHQGTLLFLSWIVWGAMLLYAIWADAHETRGEKIRNTMLLPASVIGFYLFAAAQIFALLPMKRKL